MRKQGLDSFLMLSDNKSSLIACYSVQLPPSISVADAICRGHWSHVAFEIMKSRTRVHELRLWDYDNNFEADKEKSEERK